MSGSFYIPNYAAIAAAAPRDFNRVISQEFYNAVFSTNGFTSNAASDVGIFRSQVATLVLAQTNGIAGVGAVLSGQNAALPPEQFATVASQPQPATVAANLQTQITNLRTTYSIT